MPTHRRVKASLAALAIALTPVPLLSAAYAAPARADAVFSVYLDTPSDGGNDANNGLSTATPVTTLGRVQQIISRAAPQSDVEVRVKQGTYPQPPITWTTYVPGHTISFLPIDYQYGGNVGSIAGRPVFRNPGGDGTWFFARVPSGGAPLAGGGTAGLRFYYLQVQGYQGGVSLDGGTVPGAATSGWTTVDAPSGAGLNGNTLYGMEFEDIGDSYTGGAWGYGALILTDSSANSIVNNHFDHIENTSAYASSIHGVYLTHFSSDNDISDNAFTYNSGDPVKVRDQSDSNDIASNVFTKTGTHSFYYEEFCDQSCVNTSGKPLRECASWYNRFADNHDLSGYDATLPTWSLSPSGNTPTDPPPQPGCPTMGPGAYRLHTASNTTT